MPDPLMHWRPCSDQDLPPRKKREKRKCSHCHKEEMEVPVREGFLEEATTDWRSRRGEKEVACSWGQGQAFWVEGTAGC